MMESEPLYLFLLALGVASLLISRIAKGASRPSLPRGGAPGVWPGASYVQSPHHGPRGEHEIRYIVIHYTAGGIGAAGWFQKPESKVSAHFVVSRPGALYQCVPLDRAAWHAGQASINGQEKVNECSIGIELENYGRVTETTPGVFKSESGTILRVPAVRHGVDYWEPFTDSQMATLRSLVADLRESYPGISAVVGHSEIAVPAGRKLDPGPAFNWGGVR